MQLQYHDTVTDTVSDTVNWSGRWGSNPHYSGRNHEFLPIKRLPHNQTLAVAHRAWPMGTGNGLEQQTGFEPATGALGTRYPTVRSLLRHCKGIGSGAEAPCRRLPCLAPNAHTPQGKPAGEGGKEAPGVSP